MDEQATVERPPHVMSAPGMIAERQPRARRGSGTIDEAKLSRAPAEDDRPSWPAVRRGLLRRCPHCGEGRLFDGYLKVTDSCAACGEVLKYHRADDGPAYLTILVVGHLLAFAMHFIWVQFRPEPLVFATLLAVAAVGLSLWLLPRFKGAIVGFQWARRMHGFGGDHR